MTEMDASSVRDRIIDGILPGVETPGQYAGGEWNSIVKDPGEVDVRIALAFPDTYTIGMSYLGLQILYSVVNARERFAAERVFAPWPDMEAQLRKWAIPLYTLESFTPLREFDVLGFSLQYEMCYSNVLTMLDLAGIPLRADERNDEDPLVIAGGPCALSPEPLADFIDVFVLGDGEDALVAFLERLRELKSSGVASRRERIRELVRSVPGLYAPALYDARHDSDGAFRALVPNEAGVPEVVSAAAVDLACAHVPTCPIVPFVETVHDRISIEIMRGCTRGCRFCQAGMTKRPTRSRSVDDIVRAAKQTYEATGHREVSLASLSTSDYPDLCTLMERVSAQFDPLGVNISLPSLRVGEQLSMLPSILKRVRRAGLTIAPEAGSLRLRRVINKDVEDEHLYQAAEEAYRQGWRLVKLYFMVGLPTETPEDIDAIVGVVRRVSELRRKVAKGPGAVNVAIANFVPKPHTPFQWEPMADAETFEAARDHLRGQIKRGPIRLKFHRADRSQLEGVFARGDRRLGRVLDLAWRKGRRLDAWDEHFDADVWMEAFRESGIDPSYYTMRARDLDEPLPWSHVCAGVSREFLLREREKAYRAETTPDCRYAECTRCGACDGARRGDSARQCDPKST